MISLPIEQQQELSHTSCMPYKRQDKMLQAINFLQSNKKPLTDLNKLHVFTSFIIIYPSLRRKAAIFGRPFL